MSGNAIFSVKLNCTLKQVSKPPGMVDQPKILWLLLALKLNCCMFSTLIHSKQSLSFVMQNYFKTLIQFSNSKRYDSYRIFRQFKSDFICTYINGLKTIIILLSRVLHASNSSNMVSKDQKCENPIHISSRVRTQDISTYKVVWYKG